MKIIIISDIHSNIYGLKAVLDNCGSFDKILVAGDITGYYPFANEVIDELVKIDALAVKGNHDWYLIQGFPPENSKPQVKKSFDFTKKIISRDSLNYIKELPDKLEFLIEGKKVFVCHGSPWNLLGQRIYPNYSDFEKFRSIDADVIVLGHTHYPFIKMIGNKIIFNPGSCGQPRDYNLLSYAVWDTKKNEFEIKRIEWDIEQFKKEALKKGTDPELFEVFDRTKTI